MLHYLLRAVHGGAANGELKAAINCAAARRHVHVNASFLFSGFITAGPRSVIAEG